MGGHLEHERLLTGDAQPVEGATEARDPGGDRTDAQVLLQQPDPPDAGTGRPDHRVGDGRLRVDADEVQAAAGDVAAELHDRDVRLAQPVPHVAPELGGDAQHAVHAEAQELLDRAFLVLGRVLGHEEQHGVAGRAALPFDGRDQRGVEGVGRVGDDQADDHGPAGHQRAGVAVGDVAEPLGLGAHQSSGSLADLVFPGQRARHGVRRQAQPVGHIA